MCLFYIIDNCSAYTCMPAAWASRSLAGVTSLPLLSSTLTAERILVICPNTCFTYARRNTSRSASSTPVRPTLLALRASSLIRPNSAICIFTSLID